MEATLPETEFTKEKLELVKENPRRLHPLDVANQRFGRLTVKKFMGRKLNSPNKGTICWYVKCDCGNEKIVAISDLTSGHTTSCGCKQIEAAKKTLAPINKKASERNNGLSKQPWLQNYKNILQRLFNKNYHAYDHYREKIQGPLIEQSWLDDPWEFYKEIGDKPDPHASVDRIDNTKGYVIGNVRWAERTRQARNRTEFTTNTTGYKGVFKSKREKEQHRPWIAKIRVNTKEIYLGSYKTIEEAALARYDAEEKYNYTHTFKRPELVNPETKKTPTSIYNGVNFDRSPSRKNKPWKASIRVNGKVKTVGRFAEEKEAAIVRFNAEEEYKIPHTFEKPTL